MRFDNAFLTATNTVGMQFVDGKSTYSVYRNKKGEVVCSPCEESKQEKLIELFCKLEGRYISKEK